VAGRRRIAWALALLVTLVALGFVAKTSIMTSADVYLDEDLAALRHEALTALAKAITDAASSTVGAAAAVIVPVVLWLAHRRRDAVHALLLIGGALAVAFLVKALVHEHRPPQRLWVIAPNNPYSFPSGHATVAAALALTAVLITSGRSRPLVAAVGALFAAGVALTRLYLGVHYLPDVAGGFLVAACAELLAAGLLQLPLVNTRLRAPDQGSSNARRTAQPAHTSARNG
jgi:membrane-associated phospholipid phosphatase